LTGTPIQNSFKELWCLLDWANPGSVGEWRVFDTSIANPILEGQKFNASRVELSVAKVISFPFFPSLFYFIF